MNENDRSTGKTLPFARPVRASRRSGVDNDAHSVEQDWEEMLNIVRQQPDVNISKTIALYSQVSAGRYQPNACRIADRMLQLEARLQYFQGSAGS